MRTSWGLLPTLAVGWPLLCLLAVAGCQTMAGAARPGGSHIVWRTLEEGLEEATMRNRPVLVDFYAGRVCHRCLTLDDTVYRDPALVTMINRYFIPVRVWTTRPLSPAEQALERRLGGDGECILALLAPDGGVLHDDRGRPLASMEMLSRERYRWYLEQGLAASR